MSDANTPNIPPSQPNFSADGNWQVNWGEPITDESLEEQLLALSDFTNFTEESWQENSPDCERGQILEEQFFSSLETMDDFESSSETVNLEAFLVTSEQKYPSGESQEETNWFEIAHQLEQQNQELSATILQLKQALDDSHQQLQAQIERSQNAETTIAQQADALHQIQDQTAAAVARMEASHRSTVASLSQQLEFSQQQTAQLEREYAILQEECNDKAQKLSAMEKHLRELWTRLHRQQRYALEYKTALEQYLGNSGDRADNFPFATTISAIEPWSDRKELDIFDVDAEQSFVMEVSASAIEETTESDPESLALNSSATSPSPVISSTRQPRVETTVDLPSFLRTRRS